MLSNSGQYSELELGAARERVRRPAGVPAAAFLLLLHVFSAAVLVWFVGTTLSGDTLLTGENRQHISAAVVTLLIASLPAAVFAIGLFGLQPIRITPRPGRLGYEQARTPETNPRAHAE
jgi:hypothetical protein